MASVPLTPFLHWSPPSSKKLLRWMEKAKRSPGKNVHGFHNMQGVPEKKKPWHIWHRICLCFFLWHEFQSQIFPSVSHTTHFHFLRSLVQTKLFQWWAQSQTKESERHTRQQWRRCICPHVCKFLSSLSFRNDFISTREEKASNKRDISREKCRLQTSSLAITLVVVVLFFCLPWGIFACTPSKLLFYPDSMQVSLSRILVSATPLTHSLSLSSPFIRPTSEAGWQEHVALWTDDLNHKARGEGKTEGDRIKPVKPTSARRQRGWQRKRKRLAGKKGKGRKKTGKPRARMGRNKTVPWGDGNRLICLGRRAWKRIFPTLSRKMRWKEVGGERRKQMLLTIDLSKESRKTTWPSFSLKTKRTSSRNIVASDSQNKNRFLQIRI